MPHSRSEVIKYMNEAKRNVGEALELIDQFDPKTSDSKQTDVNLLFAASVSALGIVVSEMLRNWEDQSWTNLRS